MRIVLRRLIIRNFRGIRDADVTFAQLNFIVGDNGAGKTSLLAAIARLHPILRGDRRIFLDADFLFTECGAMQPALTYFFDACSSRDETHRYVLSVFAERVNAGGIRSNLNDQVPGMLYTYLTRADGVSAWAEEEFELGDLVQKIIRSGWLGSRVAPVGLGLTGEQRHASTVTGDEIGDADALRARLVESLRGTSLGVQVDRSHPMLKNNVIRFANAFLGDARFVDIDIGTHEDLILVQTGGLTHSWQEISSGEQVAFGFAMATEFTRAANPRFALVEEPEAHLHPRMQQKVMEVLSSAVSDAQFFVATHSPYIIEQHLSSSTVILATRDGAEISLMNRAPQTWLFRPPTWSEISYYAYCLPTFEFHNQLYGWIQEKSENRSERDIETYFLRHGMELSKKWIKVKSDGSRGQPYDVTLMTYIRNFTHHPENRHNATYSQNDLSSSIRKMLEITESLRRR